MSQGFCARPERRRLRTPGDPATAPLTTALTGMLIPAQRVNGAVAPRRRQQTAPQRALLVVLFSSDHAREGQRVSVTAGARASWRGFSAQRAFGTAAALFNRAASATMEATAAAASMAATTKPVVSYKLHGLTASVFANEGKNKDGGAVRYFKVSLTRTYKDADGFKSTSSLSAGDLPVAQYLLAKAHAWVCDQELAAKDAS